MLTLPNTDGEEPSSDIDKNTPEFQTPPENHYGRSSSSSQELLSQVCGVTEETTVRVDDVVCLGGGEGKTLDFSELNGDDGDQCWEKVKEVEKIAGFETDLKSLRFSEDGIGESMSKKISVSEKLGFHDETGVTEKVDWAEIELEGLVRNDISFPEVQDSPVKEAENHDSSNSKGGTFGSAEASQNSQSPGSDAGPQERLEEKALEEEQFPVYNVDLASLGGVKGALEDDTLKAFEIPVVALACETERVEDDGKLKDRSFDGGVVDKEKVEENCSVDNVGLSEKASPEMAVDDAPDVIRKDSRGSLRRKAAEEIESFRCEGDGFDCARKRVFKGRRELPLSIRGKEKDIEVEDKGRNVEAEEGYLPGGKEKDVEAEDKPKNMEPKELTFLEILDAVEKLFNFDKRPKLEEVDFLEIAKERGMTFPKPRWR